MNRDKEKDIEKIKALHSLKTNFNSTDEIQELLKKQLKDEKYQSELERFYSGFDAEDIFRYVFSALPWVKLVIKLGQEQLPVYSKENYQVPDFLVYYENNKMKDVPLLIEVKTVNGDKMKLELMEKQVQGLINFSKALKIPLLFAIYWRKQNNWIITSLDYFEQKQKQYYINIVDAIMYDISIFLSNDSFIISPNLFVKTTYSKQKNNDSQVSDKKYGYVIHSEASIDGKNFIEIKDFEMAVLDSFIDFQEVSKIEEENTIILEKSEVSYIPRFSYIIMRYLRTFKVENTTEVYPVL